jgi:hypothetical protein
MDLTRLTRTSYRHDRPTVPLLGRFRLPAARTHEFCGPTRRRLALWLARGTEGHGAVDPARSGIPTGCTWPVCGRRSTPAA